MTGVVLELRTDTVRGVPMVSVVGEVDRLSGKTLKRAIGEVLRREDGLHCLLVDLTECTYVDAVALSVLMSARDRLAPGHCLGLLGASDNIRHLFMLIGFEENDTMHFLTSRAEAEGLIEKLGDAEGARAMSQSGPRGEA